MPRLPNDLPVYRCHKASNQAITTVRLASGARRDIYLGVWRSPASKAEYGRIVALVTANGGIYPSTADDLTVNEAMVRYVRHIDAYYAGSGSAVKIKAVLKYLKRLFGSTKIAEFGPPEFKVVRAAMIADGLARTTINKSGRLIRQFIRWCVEERIVHPDVLGALRAVMALSPGRSGAAETIPRKPADPTDVAKTLPHLPSAVRAVMELLRLTGARPSELAALRPCDIDRSTDVWTYNLQTHKTTWKGKSRTIHFGPAAQQILLPWLEGAVPEQFVFSPRRSEDMRNGQRSKDRKTRAWPSHMKRNAAKRPKVRKLPPTDRYDADGLARAVLRTCKRIGVTPWSPYQLRHLRAVELREKYGLETVRAVLGQSAAAIADHYSKGADAVLAGRAAKEIG